MSQGLMNVLLLVPTFLFSLCVHEFAHAWTAVKRGDKTPMLLGRLSLHPMAHADIVGTLVLPTLCIYYGLPFFGWAKPVPIDARNFKYGRRDMALVAAAGPAANVILALIATAGLGVFVRMPAEHSIVETLQVFAVVSIQVNLTLAIFNMLPIPPLDGYNVLAGFLPARAVVRLSKMSRYAGIVLLLLLFTGGFRVLSVPITYCFHVLIQLVT